MGAASDFDDDGSRQRSGCFVSTAVGVLLFLLAVAVAVGVGLLVHFAHPDKNKSCTEIIPEDIMDGNCPDGDVSLVPDDDIWAACVNISIANDECKSCDIYGNVMVLSYHGDLDGALVTIATHVVLWSLSVIM